MYTPWSDAASKHATQAYFDCLRAEMERYGIPVTVISPGYIRTSLSVNAVTGDGSKYGGEAVKQVCDCVNAVPIMVTNVQLLMEGGKPFTCIKQCK